MKKNFKVFVVLLLIVSGNYCKAQNYYQNGGTASLSSQAYSSSTPDTSTVRVIGAGNLTLSSSTITKTGDCVLVVDSSSKYGRNAGVLVKAGSKITFTNVTITTNGKGANGIFATGTGSSVTMTGGSITCSATGSHGIDVVYGGSITLNNVNVTTAGNSASAALSTDYGGGTLNVTGGVIKTTGTKSPGIYSTGSVTVTDARIIASAGNGGVIDGSNSINLTNTYLQGTTNGIKCHSTSSGSNTATINISGDTIKATSGNGFLVSGTKANINISNAAKILTSSTIILDVDSGTATFTASGDTLSGNFHTDIYSNLTVTLNSKSSLNGYINKVDSATTVTLSMDATSKWNVTANSYVDIVSDQSGISGTSVVNITGNGYNVYYDPALSSNTYLGGLSYNLINGGCLMPVGGTCLTGINEMIKDPYTVSCFPNPINNYLFVSTEEPATEIAIYNFLGDQIYENDSPGTDTIINTDKYEEGLYFIQIIFHDKIMVIKKIIKC
jgi:hypothetical protein